MTIRNPTVPIIVLSLSAFALKAQEPPPAAERTRAPVGKAARAAEPPMIDGHLDDVAWNEAPILSGFVQREPVEGEPVSERTEVRLVYDESALYVGAWMFVDDPSTIVVGETRRDASLDELRKLARGYPEHAGVQEYFAKGLFNILNDAKRKNDLCRRRALVAELRELADAHPANAAIQEALERAERLGSG